VAEGSHWLGSGDRAGTAVPFFKVFTIQKIISQIVFGNFAGEFVEMVAQLAHIALSAWFNINLVVTVLHNGH